MTIWAQSYNRINTGLNKKAFYFLSHNSPAVGFSVAKAVSFCLIASALPGGGFSHAPQYGSHPLGLTSASGRGEREGPIPFKARWGSCIYAFTSPGHTKLQGKLGKAALCSPNPESLLLQEMRCGRTVSNLECSSVRKQPVFKNSLHPSTPRSNVSSVLSSLNSR